MIQDFLHALRSMVKAPGFTAVVVLTLAVGIGGNTALFSVVNGVLLKALPYPAPDRLVMVWEASARNRTIRVSNPNFEDWHEQSRSFAGLAAYSGARTTVLGGTEPVFAGVFGVSKDFFDVLGVRPYLGRTFTESESTPNASPSIVISYGLWQRILGGNPDLDAATLKAVGATARVVGVMPRGFEFPSGADVWYPREISPDLSGRTAHNLWVVGRLADGTTIEQARSEMTTIVGRIEALHGDDNDSTDANVEVLLDALVGSSRRALLLLLGAVGLVLLAACANVASTLLARGTERQKELAIRMALGANRRRLVRQLLTENLTLALAGGAAGLLLGGWMVRALVVFGPAVLPRTDAIAIDGRVVLFTFLLSCLTPLFFGLVPSAQVTQRDLRDAIAEGGRHGGTSGRSTARNALVAVEVALALLLLVGSGLLARSFINVVSVDPGFDPSRVVTFQTALPADRYPTPPQTAEFYRRFLEQIRTLPGVERTGIINSPPLGGMDANGGFLRDGQDFEAIRGDWMAQSASYRVVSPGYFGTLGIPILRGRDFTEQDSVGSEAVAVINQTMASRYWPDQDPIGIRFRFAGMDRVNPWLTIVGVVGDVRHRDLAGPVVPEAYVSYIQNPLRTSYFMTTTVKAVSGFDEAELVASLRRALHGLDADVPAEFSTMEAHIESSVATRQLTLLVVGGFGAVALLLAAIGIYGVLAFTVVQRTPEIGIRMALGAEAGSVVGLVLRGALGAVLTGAAVGLAAVFALTRLLQAFLFEVQPTDPLTIAGMLALLLFVAWLSGYVPARRATRVDPLIAIRAE